MLPTAPLGAVSPRRGGGEGMSRAGAVPPTSSPRAQAARTSPRCRFSFSAPGGAAPGAAAPLPGAAVPPPRCSWRGVELVSTDVPPRPWGCLCQEQPAGKHYLWPEPDAALREAVTAHGGPASRAERMSLVRQSLASLQSAFLIKCISTTPGCRLSVPQAAHGSGVAWPRSGAQDPVVLSRARWGEGRTWS